MGLLFPGQIMAIFEALLFVSGEPVTLETLCQVTGIELADGLTVMEELCRVNQDEDRGLQIVEVANGYQICTRAEYTPYIEKLYHRQPQVLSRAALETLAIIAVRQPVTRAEIEVIRGVKADSALTGLIEKDLVQEVGRKDGPGRPILYGTTPAFLKHFGLKNPAELIALLDEVKK